MKNLPEYQLVRIKPSAGLPEEFKYGYVCGKIITEMPILGACYAVEFDKKVSEEYPYRVVGIFEAHMEIQ